MQAHSLMKALSGYILPEDIVYTVTVKAYAGPLHGDRPSVGLNSLILQWKLMSRCRRKSTGSALTLQIVFQGEVLSACVCITQI